MRHKCRTAFGALVAVFALGAVASASAWASGPPENKTLPIVKQPVSGMPVPEEFVPEESTSGTWKSEGTTTYSHKWERCSVSGGECVVETGPESVKEDFKPIEADVGHTLRVRESAENSYGKTTAYSLPSAVVLAAGQVTAYYAPGIAKAEEIAAGPDGNLWFTASVLSKECENETCGQIDKITTSGTATVVRKSPSPPTTIIDGSKEEDALRFIQPLAGGRASLSKITTSGTITEYELPTGYVASGALGLKNSESGGLWFGGTYERRAALMQLGPSGGFGWYFLPEQLNAKINAIANGLVVGTAWSTQEDPAGVRENEGRLDPLPESSEPTGIVVPREEGGAMWVTERGANKLVELTEKGSVEEELSLPASSEPTAITEGAGGIWFLEPGTDKIGRLQMSTGAIAEYPLKSAPVAITAGPDDNLWVTTSEGTVDKITD